MKTQTQAIEQVIENNTSDYSRLMNFAVKWIKETRKEFTSADIKTDFLKSNEPVKSCVYGAVFTSLEREGAIGYKRHKKSNLPAARGRQIAVWISKMIPTPQPTQSAQMAMF